MTNESESGCEEPIDDLISRVKPMIDEIDLDNDITPDMAFNIAIAEIPGTKASDINKRMLVLVDQDRITSDEYMRIALSTALI